MGTHFIHDLKVLFAGGCHVNGFPVGQEFGFPAITSSELESAGVRCEIRCMGHLALHQLQRVEDACREFQPDMLVLQVGNYELGNELTPYVLSRFGLKRGKKKSSSSSAGPVLDVPRWRYLLRGMFKQIIDMALCHPLVDWQAFEIKVQHFMAAVAACNVNQVIVLSPTPCVDRTARYYRFRGARMLERAAADHAWTYLNLLALEPRASEPRLGKQMFFADAIHLGTTGHAAVGQAVAARVNILLQRCAPTQ
jgi:hypothetical protein